MILLFPQSFQHFSVSWSFEVDEIQDAYEGASRAEYGLESYILMTRRRLCHHLAGIHIALLALFMFRIPHGEPLQQDSSWRVLVTNRVIHYMLSGWPGLGSQPTPEEMPAFAGAEGGAARWNYAECRNSYA